MNQSEAMAKARAVIRTITDIDVDPDSIEFKSIGGRRRWTAFFGRGHFTEQRSTEGGEGYTVIVNDKTGDVTVCGPTEPRHT